MVKAMQSQRAVYLAILSLVLFVAVPFVGRSSFFLQPVSISVGDDHFVLVRETPLGATTARWKAEIYVPASGRECSDRGEDLFQPRPFDTVRFPISDALAPCLGTGRTVVMTMEWTVILFGWLPLRPVTMTTTFGSDT